MTHHDHPHAHGQDEIFQHHAVFEINVDLARRLAESGDIATIRYAMPVRDAGRKLLGLPDEMFGIAAASGNYDVARDILEAMNARVLVDVSRLEHLTPESMECPALMVMWNLKGEDAASARMRRGRPSETSDHVFPVLCDGNHRLAKAFLDGREEPLPCLIVREWTDVEKFLSYLGKPVVRPAKRPSPTPEPPRHRRGG